MNKWWLSVSLAVLGVLGGGCQCGRVPVQTKDAGLPGAQCSVDQDCGAGEICVSLTCVAGTRGTDGGNCASNPEVCDGVDNNCDGQVDEGFNTASDPDHCGASCVKCSFPNAASVCNAGQCEMGSCNAGFANANGRADDGCEYSCTITNGGVELCDGLDNNCNGQTDENFGTQSCGVGACQRSAPVCQNAQTVTCQPGVPTTEICDGLDNDCNGQTDDAIPQVTCGQGICQQTVVGCVNGQVPSCTPGTPQTEICNGLDDNCDGRVDEGCGCVNGTTQSCYTGAAGTNGVGVCKGGTQTCSNGAWGNCLGQVTPSTEVCNGKDDNCDGQTDENLGTLSCGIGTCARTVNACQNGAAATCTPGDAGTEVCNNLLDDNCNGIVDDPAICGCDSSKDNDLDGYNECVDCNDNDGTVHPGATERCNGKDDNCNRTVDEGFDTDNDTFTTCGTFPDGGGVDPKYVDCNDRDAYVYPTKLFDCGSAATPDAGNGIDDNCNGYIDETCNCDPIDRDGDGVSDCQGDCAPNDGQVAPGKVEVCDGKDNDCNEKTVDNCGVSDPCGSSKTLADGGVIWTEFAAGTDECKPDLICTQSLTSGALTCGSFCNSTVGTGVKDSCASNEACYSDLVDSDSQKLCVAVNVGSGAIGQSCTQDEQCRSSFCLMETTTQGYCSDKCNNKASCGTGNTCFMDEIDVTSGSQLIGTAYTSYCRMNSFITGTKTLGQSCTVGLDECRTGVDGCYSPTGASTGKCIEPCCQSSQCGSGYACSINGPELDTGFVSGSGSSQVPVVSTLPVCLTSSATKVSGQACAASTECKSGICDKNLGICVDLCCDDASCPNGTTCQPVDFTFSSGKVSYIRACVFSPVPSMIEQK